MYKNNTQINFLALARVIGLLLVIEAVFMLIPALTSFIYKENDEVYLKENEKR